VVASGGGDRNPDWYADLVAHPESVAVELHGRAAVPATPQRLDGDARAQAWQRITATQPRYDKYRCKSDRRYPGGPAVATPIRPRSGRSIFPGSVSRCRSSGAADAR
jgi:hypothetical protein